MLNKTELDEKLKHLKRVSREQFLLINEISEHCRNIYGVNPAEIGCNSFLDNCIGSNSISSDQYTANNLDDDMRDALKIARMEH